MILQKYNLMSIGAYLEKPVPKKKWKETVDAAFNSHWKDYCYEEKVEKSSLKYLQIQENPLKYAHNIWRSIGHNIQDVKAGEIKARLITQTYMLQAKRFKFDSNTTPICRKCSLEEEDLEHLLLKCPMYQHIRDKYFNKIKLLLEYIEESLKFLRQRES